MAMTLRQVQEILRADVLCGTELLGREVHSACGSDFMSDVLAYVKDQALLLTGLVNPQVIRTAEMMDMKCVVFVRGKQPDGMMLDMARARELVIMTSPMRMYNACGLLYSAGLVGDCEV